jgi:ligand-binding sensor domain-containing protein
MRRGKRRSVVALIACAMLIMVSCTKEKGCQECTFTSIESFIIGADGVKYLSTNDGLFSFSEKGWKKLSGLEENGILGDLAFGPDNSLWAATEKGVLNSEADTLITKETGGLISNSVHFLDIDSDYNMFFATPEGVSVLFQGQWFDTTGRDEMFLHAQISDIASASNGYTYVSTNGGGVGRFHTDIDGITGATLFDTDWTSLRSNNVSTVFIDDTIQWYGTDKGIAIHYSEYTKWDWSNLRTYDGLISDTVISIVKDGAGNMWFGTVKGLSRYDGENWSNYTRQSDMLLSDTVEFMAVDPEGAIWIAGPDGLTQFIANEFIHFLK